MMGEPRTHANFDEWRRVGCGVESLHHLLNACGIKVGIDEVLRAALEHDGYDDVLGWRHRALVRTAADYGVSGEVHGDLTVGDLAHGLWLVSVNAPEQFESTHLVAVRAVNDGSSLHVFWPQGQLEFGERFTVPPQWLGARMTGRGMRFDAVLEATE